MLVFLFTAGCGDRLVDGGFFGDATLRLGGSEQINDAAVLHFNNGANNAKFELNGFNETIGGLAIDGGSLAIIQYLENGAGGSSTRRTDQVRAWSSTSRIRAGPNQGSTPQAVATMAKGALTQP